MFAAFLALAETKWVLKNTCILIYVHSSGLLFNYLTFLLASHLVHCKRRIAYPNPERAAQYAVQMQSASFPPLVNLDDMEQGSDDASNKWLRAFVKTSASADDEQKCKRMAISK